MATPSPVRLRCISPMGDRDRPTSPRWAASSPSAGSSRCPRSRRRRQAGTYRAPTDAELASPAGFAGPAHHGGDTGPDGQERPSRGPRPGQRPAAAQLETLERGRRPKPPRTARPEASETTRGGEPTTAERSPWPTAPVTTVPFHLRALGGKRTMSASADRFDQQEGKRRTARSPRRARRSSSAPPPGNKKPQRRGDALSAASSSAPRGPPSRRRPAPVGSTCCSPAVAWSAVSVLRQQRQQPGQRQHVPAAPQAGDRAGQLSGRGTKQRGHQPIDPESFTGAVLTGIEIDSPNGEDIKIKWTFGSIKDIQTATAYTAVTGSARRPPATKCSRSGTPPCPSVAP